jgi:hypothetical protein
MTALEPTGTAVPIAAIWGFLVFEGVFKFSLEKGLGYSNIYVSPG